MPLSTRRSIAKSPNSIRMRLNIANREPMRLVEHWNQVPNSDVLVLLHDAVRAGLAGIVNEVIRVEAAAAIPELRDPRPNGPRGASIVIARVALNCALATTSSPRIVAATSASVALQRMCHGRSNGEPAQIGTAESVSKIKGASSRVSPSGLLLGHPRETTMIVRMYVNRAGGPSRAGRPPGQGFANVARLPGIALSSRLHLQPGSTRLATAVRDSASA